MESEINIQKNIIIELSEDEAIWLKALVQNPIGCEVEDEYEKDFIIRKKFWDALKDM